MAEFKDKILCEVRDSYPSYTCWKPSSLYSLARDSTNSYCSFENVVRTMHWDDFDEVWRKEQMIPNALTERTHTHLTKNLPGLPYLPGLKGLWYGIDVPDNGQNNWYGNVSLKANFWHLLKMLHNFNIYFVEVVEFRTKSASRLLITTQDLPLERYDPHRFGGPWYRDPNSGEDYFLTDARRFNGTENIYGHDVEIIFVISDAMCDSLFKMSIIEPVNHYEANSGSKNMCRKHRSGGEKGICTSPWTMEESYYYYYTHYHCICNKNVTL